MLSLRRVATQILMALLFLWSAGNAAGQASHVGATLEGTVSDGSGAAITQAEALSANWATT
jgi:hypothetical protein